jgi:hypothetical protein
MEGLLNGILPILIRAKINHGAGVTLNGKGEWRHGPTPKTNKPAPANGTRLRRD